MYARLLGLVCLLSINVQATGFETNQTASVNVYIKSNEQSSSPVLSGMRRELVSLLRRVGVQVDFWIPEHRLSSVDGLLVVVDFRGKCEAPEAQVETLRRNNVAPLAASAVADGRVLPFSWVDCAAVNSFLSDSMVSMSGPQRVSVYGRALARLLAHEIYHVVTQHVDHQVSGVAKARFTARDLTSDGFDFLGSTLASPLSHDHPSSRGLDLVAGR